MDARARPESGEWEQRQHPREANAAQVHPSATQQSADGCLHLMLQDEEESARGSLQGTSK